MKITIATTDSPDSLDHETLILGFFSDERPPKGYAGFVDWRLHGVLSREMVEGRISGALLEIFALAFPTRIRVERLILVGLGPLAELTGERLCRGGEAMAVTLHGLGATDIALTVPGAGRSRLETATMTEAFFMGLYDGFMRDPQRMDALRIDIQTPSDQLEASRLGLDRFRRRTGDARVWVLEPGGSAANPPGGQRGRPGGEMEAVQP